MGAQGGEHGLSATGMVHVTMLCQFVCQVVDDAIGKLVVTRDYDPQESLADLGDEIV